MAPAENHHHNADLLQPDQRVVVEPKIDPSSYKALAIVLSACMVVVLLVVAYNIWEDRFLKRLAQEELEATEAAEREADEKAAELRRSIAQSNLAAPKPARTRPRPENPYDMTEEELLAVTRSNSRISARSDTHLTHEFSGTTVDGNVSPGCCRNCGALNSFVKMVTSGKGKEKDTGGEKAEKEETPIASSSHTGVSGGGVGSSASSAATHAPGTAL